MHKLWLIIKREYLTRVKSKSFLLSTLLTPLAFAALILVSGLISSYQDKKDRKVAIIDTGNLLNKVMKDEDHVYYTFSSKPLDALKAEVKNGDYAGIMVIPKLDSVTVKEAKILFYAEEQLGLDEKSNIENQIGDRISQYKMQALGIKAEVLESIKTEVTLDPEPISAEQKDESSKAAAIGAGLGMVMGIIMYISVFLYGTMVMRSVMEEKMTRIVEVMISSVKPFQLMLGKILGVGAVGLTQFIIWMILIPLISTAVSAYMGFTPSSSPVAGQGMAQMGDPEDTRLMIGQIMAEVMNMNWWLIIPSFIFYYLCGYILYSSLFAAVGSAIGDDIGESQSLTMPITIPVIIAFYIMFAAVRAPQSSLAIWGSIIPLFSPIVMPSRLVFDIPIWQLVVSMFVLLTTTVFFVWIAGRIYRVGILMYGKKASFKELRQWIFYKD